MNKDLVYILKKKPSSKKYSSIWAIDDSLIVTNGYLLIRNDPNLMSYFKKEFGFEPSHNKRIKKYNFLAYKNTLGVQEASEREDTLLNRIKDLLSEDEDYLIKNGRRLIPPKKEEILEMDNKNKHLFFINKANYALLDEDKKENKCMFLIDATNFAVFVDKEYLTYLNETKIINHSSRFYTLDRRSTPHFLYVLNSGRVDALTPLLDDAAELKLEKISLDDVFS